MTMQNEMQLRVGVFPINSPALEVCAYCARVINIGNMFRRIYINFGVGPNIYRNLHEGCYFESGLREQIFAYNRDNVGMTFAEARGG